MGHKFICAFWEGGGIIPSLMHVVSKLMSAGHDVRVMSDACNRPDAERVGARFMAWPTAPSRVDKSAASDPVKDWEVPGPEGFRRLVSLTMTGAASRYAADLLAELRREPADLVITSEILCGVMVACESAGQPMAILTSTVSLVPLPGIPPMGRGLPPARTPDEHAAHAGMAAFNERLFNSSLTTFNHVRAELGLAPLTSLYQQWEAADAVLLGTSPAFDFTPDSLPANTRYVGPQLGVPEWAEQWRAPWASDDDRPLVLVSFSTTFQDHATVLQRVVDALGRRSARVLVTLGPALELHAVEPAENTYVVQGAPHDRVLPEAALVITHGGHGTVIAALAHGVPMLVIPHGRDQNDIAARVEAHAVGCRLPPSSSLEQIAFAIDTLMADPKHRENARRLGARVRHDAEHSPIVRELEELAARRASAGVLRAASAAIAPESL